MRLENVTLAGFRCFGREPITVGLAAEITAVVGPNAAGKIALLHALAKLIGVSIFQYAYGVLHDPSISKNMR